MTPFRDRLALGLGQRPWGSCLPRAWVRPQGQGGGPGSRPGQVWEDLQENDFDKKQTPAQGVTVPPKPLMCAQPKRAP